MMVVHFPVRTSYQYCNDRNGIESLLITSREKEDAGRDFDEQQPLPSSCKVPAEHLDPQELLQTCGQGKLHIAWNVYVLLLFPLAEILSLPL